MNNGRVVDLERWSLLQGLFAALENPGTVAAGFMMLRRPYIYYACGTEVWLGGPRCICGRQRVFADNRSTEGIVGTHLITFICCPERVGVG